MKADFHMHTGFSSDADVKPEEMIKQAIALGLETICFTDHNDMDYPKATEFRLDVDAYFAELQRLQERYREKIDIRIGVELGLQPHLGLYHHEFVQKKPFDFVIGSVHVVDGKDPYYPDFFETMTDAAAYQKTFEETLENIKQNRDFDVLGHIDYIVRYGKGRAKEYSYEKYADLIDEILITLISNGKGIELNTAGFKYGLEFCHPHPQIIKRYHELGGEILTIGSDGHKPEHIAYDFHKVKSILEACGIEYYTEFKKRKPIFKQLGQN